MAQHIAKCNNLVPCNKLSHKSMAIFSTTRRNHPAEPRPAHPSKFSGDVVVRSAVNHFSATAPPTAATTGVLHGAPAIAQRGCRSPQHHPSGP